METCDLKYAATAQLLYKHVISLILLKMKLLQVSISTLYEMKNLCAQVHNIENVFMDIVSPT